MKTSKQVAFQTLGCKLNQYETESLATQFIQNGYQVVDFKDKADVYIINTCTVTAKSDQKSRHFINQARKKPNALVVATGCYATRSKDLLEETTGITFVVPNSKKSQIFSIVDAYVKNEIYHPTESDLFNYQDTKDIFHTRAMIKIQDGCDNQCSFCIIPSVRGFAISRPPSAIITQAKNLISYGYHEIVLTGVNMSRYLYENLKFSDILEHVLSLEGNFRIRISSLEPENIDEHFISLLEHPKMCKHLHLCLQSGSNKILFNMRRNYTYESYAEIITKIRSRVPDINITTDIIVGFPEESEKEFELTLNAIQSLEIGKTHIFKYSARAGTRAARMGNQVPEETKDSRVKALQKISEEMKEKFYNRFIGKPLTLLVESVGNGFASGYTENYIYAKIPYEGKSNQFITFESKRLAYEENKPFLTI